jgi:hypothetical protein
MIGDEYRADTVRQLSVELVYIWMEVTFQYQNRVDSHSQE